MDTLKLNCNAAFLVETHSGSWGVIIRDADGEVVNTGRGRVNHLRNPFHVELIACLQGIQLAVNMGIGHIIVETDAQEVVKAVNSREYDDSAVSHLIEEIKSLLGSNFLNHECVFVSRECNQAAHRSAALGFLCTEGEDLVTSSLSESVYVIVANDLCQ